MIVSSPEAAMRYGLGTAAGVMLARDVHCPLHHNAIRGTKERLRCVTGVVDDVRRSKQSGNPHASRLFPIELEVRRPDDGVRPGALLNGESVTGEVAKHATR